VYFPSEESELIAQLQSILGRIDSDVYETGIGDDAAVRRCADSRIVLTTDLTVENVHFTTELMTLEEAGYRAMVSNVSDCAAMGALPEAALVQLVFPGGDSDVKAKIKDIYRGFSKACRKWNFSVIGGDLSSGRQWVIGITLLGRIPEGSRPVMRRGAKAGDSLWLSGMPGKSAAGFDALKNWGRKGMLAEYSSLVDSHITPEPRVEYGLSLALCEEVHAMMDLSDGISKDAATLGFENSLGILLDLHSLQPPNAMVRLSQELKCSWLDWVLHGGEEYELLFAASPLFEPGKISMNQAICIGKFTDRFKGVRILQNGTENEIPLKSWDHFRKV
jgi:thiamine-monophosphate kinase